jgi:peroxin-19
LQDGDGNNEFKGALDSVVKDIISKDSLYDPMKKLKDEYPNWLENNWDKVSDDDLERYNKQLDKVTEICSAFEKQEGGEVKEDIFELLN